MKNNLEELKATLEAIRKEKHPEIPSALIAKIVEIQASHQDDPSKRQTETERIIDMFVQDIKND